MFLRKPKTNPLEAELEGTRDKLNKRERLLGKIATLYLNATGNEFPPIQEAALKILEEAFDAYATASDLRQQAEEAMKLDQGARKAYKLRFGDDLPYFAEEATKELSDVFRKAFLYMIFEGKHKEFFGSDLEADTHGYPQRRMDEILISAQTQEELFADLSMAYKASTGIDLSKSTYEGAKGALWTAVLEGGEVIKAQKEERKLI